MRNFVLNFLHRLRLFSFSLFLLLGISFSAKAASAALTSDQSVLFQRLHAQAPDLPASVLQEALHAYFQARQEGLIQRNVLTVIDYALASTKRRLWTFDLDSEQVLFYTYVAHGRNSGTVRYANHFSNEMNSKESSLGLFVTRETYIGHLGYSLRLMGLEAGINDRAYDRDIVVHGASYVGEDFVRHYGRLGRSWGCPAVDEKIVEPFIDTIKGGSAIFSYYPSRDFLQHSVYL
jgi:hypothetical protein